MRRHYKARAYALAEQSDADAMSSQSNSIFFMGKKHDPNATPNWNPIVGKMYGSQACSKPWAQDTLQKEVHAAAVRAGTNFKGR